MENKLLRIYPKNKITFQNLYASRDPFERAILISNNTIILCNFRDNDNRIRRRTKQAAVEREASLANRALSHGNNKTNKLGRDKVEATLQTRFTRRCVSRKRRNRALAPRMTGLTPGSVSSGLRRVQRTNVMQSIYEPTSVSLFSPK